MQRFSAIAVHLSLAMILTACLAGCVDEETDDDLGVWVGDVFTEAYPADSVASMRVANLNGNVVVSTWDGAELGLYVEKLVREKWEDQLDKTEVNVTLIGGELVVQIILHTQAAQNVSTNMYLKVPENLTITLLKTVNGNVEVAGVANDLELQTTNGNIEADDIQGYVNATATNGDIDILNVTGVGDLTTLNGNVDVRVRAIRDNVTISSITGNIEVWLLESLNVNLTLTVSVGLIDLHDLEVNLTINQEKHKEGTLGQGGPMIAIATSTGDIDLHRICVTGTCTAG